MNQRAIFLDRDGTIIKEKNYLKDFSEVELIDGVVEGLRLLREMRFKLVIITNQSGIKRGIITKEELKKVHKTVKELLIKEDITINGIYFSPDLPEERSTTRKPQTGLIEKAERELKLKIRGSYCIGDKKEDIEMGKKKGLRTILVLTGYGRVTKENVKPDYIAKNLLDAAFWIRKEEEG
ncbi:HAD family hydrolase [candidate division WOR-3 bacterium]|nr:HAD family hydrolase [candidate division WOR-3 bacterium]